MGWLSTLLEAVRSRIVVGASLEEAIARHDRATDDLDAAVREVLRK